LVAHGSISEFEIVQRHGLALETWLCSESWICFLSTDPEYHHICDTIIWNWRYRIENPADV